MVRRGRRRRSWLARGRKLAVEHLEYRHVLSGHPVISEFMASNGSRLQDEDGDHSDWIELHNPADQGVHLGDWYLTDNESDLTKWQLPPVDLAPGGYLVVFASNKDRAVAGSELHTNFALSAEGEYLALVQPDGATVASEFAPGFPPQLRDVSYGIAEDGHEMHFIATDDSAHVLVPADHSLGTTWTTPAFTPGAAWQSGSLGVGYHTGEVPPESTTVLQVDFNDRGTPGNTQAAFAPFVLGGSGIQTQPVTRSFGELRVTLVDASGDGYDDRLRPEPIDAGQFTDGRLLQDFVFSRESTGTGGLDAVIEGLTPGATYTLTVWSFDTSSNGLRVSDWAANGIVAHSDYGFDGFAVPPSPESNDIYKFAVVVAADSTGKITLQGRRDSASNTFGVFLNALQLDTGDALNGPAGIEDVLRVDFNDRTTGESGAANTEPGYSVMTLDDNGATFGGVRVTLSPYGRAELDDRDRPLPIDSGGFTLDQVYDDFVYATGGDGDGIEIFIEGLVPGVEYDLVLRSFDGDTSGGNRVSTWMDHTADEPVTLASTYVFNDGVPPTSNDDYVIRAGLIASPQGTLRLRGVQSGPARSVVVNTLELTRASVAGLIGTDVKDAMLGQSSSAYIRVPFSATGVASIDELLLDLQYDAGFVAYLNGQEVACRNAPTPPGTPPAYNAAGTLERSTTEALATETFDLTPFIGRLTEGSDNVLAIHGLNSGADDGDFLILPRLRARTLEGQALKYFDRPTPGAPNVGGYVGFASGVEFSAGRGLYESPLSLELHTPTTGADIYYTLDGSVPGPQNPAAAEYTGPVLIDGTTFLRAAALKEDFLPSAVRTQSYIFLDDVLAQDPLNDPGGPDYPTTWQANAPADFEMDPEVVAAWDDENPANEDFGIRQALQSLPSMSIVMDHEDLWNSSSGIYPNATSRGSAWRRPGSIEYVDPATGDHFQFNVGVQMHGGASRDNVRLKKHSFRLVFSSEFDGPGTLEFPLFDNSHFADINTVVMRASFTDSFATRTITNRYSPLDSMYIRDVWMRDTQLAMGSPSADSTFIHLYINGLYWGLYSPAERPDDAFLASRIGGEREDWDVIRNFNELFRGEKSAWNEMFALARRLPSAADPDAIYFALQGRNPDGTPSSALPVYLDVDNLIDYMILHLYAGPEDWPHHNWVAARNRVDPGKGFQFFTWDQEIVLDGRFRDRTEASDSFSPAELHALLRSSPEFRLRFADRVQKHLFNDGVLTTQANQERWLARAQQIEKAIIAESARWGDAREGEVVTVSSGQPSVRIPVMTVDHWRAERDNVHDNYFPESHSLTIGRFRSDGLFPAVAAPQLSQHGGTVLPGYSLGMTSPTAGARIYFTTDGSDPRVPGGRVNRESASVFSDDVALTRTTTVKARALLGGAWSALSEATFRVASGSRLVISEINYHPHPPTAAEAAQLPGVEDDDFEFLEFFNPHPTDSISLQDMSLAGGVSFTFGNISLAPGEYALVVENRPAFEARYGTGWNIVGQWRGTLSNAGESIELLDAAGEPIMAVSYSDSAPWSEAADGDGATLVLIDPWSTPAGGLGAAHHWRRSIERGGSPGAAGAEPAPGDFDADGRYSLADLDQLLTAIEEQSPIAYYDRNADGSLNSADVEYLIRQIVHPIAGDYNWDGTVDDADRILWNSHYGSDLYLSADGNSNGIIDAADYTVWRDHLGATGPVASARPTIAKPILSAGTAQADPSSAAAESTTSSAARETLPGERTRAARLAARDRAFELLAVNQFPRRLDVAPPANERAPVARVPTTQPRPAKMPKVPVRLTDHSTGHFSWNSISSSSSPRSCSMLIIALDGMVTRTPAT